MIAPVVPAGSLKSHTTLPLFLSYARIRFPLFPPPGGVRSEGGLRGQALQRDWPKR